MTRLCRPIVCAMRTATARTVYEVWAFSLLSRMKHYFPVNIDGQIHSDRELTIPSSACTARRL